MDTSGLSAIELILWVLAANGILILSAYGLALWWRKKNQAAILKMVEKLQDFDRRLDALFEVRDLYKGIDKPPYSDLLKAFSSETGELQIEIERLREANRTFEAQISTPSDYRMLNRITTPFRGFHDHRRAAMLQAESAAIAARLEKAESQVEQLSELPWELANQCRQADKDAAELADFAGALRSKGVRGQALQDLLARLDPIRFNLNRIPSEFLRADHDAVLKASFDTTVQVYSALEQTRPNIDLYLPMAREWHEHHQKATIEFAELKQMGVNLRVSLARPPDGLLIQPLQNRLDQVAQMAADLSTRLEKPEVDQLKPLAREVSQLRRVVQDTEQQFVRATRQISELGQAIREENTRLEQMAAQFAELEHSETFPLVWDESGPVLNYLRQLLKGLGPADQPRTPGQLVEHLKEIEHIRAEYKPLAEKQPRIRAQHNALVALLNGLELREGGTWLRKAKEMLAQAAVYDPRNWPKQDSIQTLPAEIEELNRLHEQMVPGGRTTPIQEGRISERLKETQQLVEKHKTLRPRVESVRARLEKIRVQEEEGKQKLTGAYSALERIDLLTESNVLLEQIAMNEIDRLMEEIRQSGNELNTQNQGEVEKKIQKINALNDRVLRSLNQWLGRLNTAIAEQGRKISGWLTQLDAVGVLDDAPIQDARDLLAQETFTSTLQSAPGAPLPVGGSSNPAQRGAAALKGAAARLTTERKLALTELEVTAEIKRKNDFWQHLLATQAAMDEKVGPLLTAFQETIEARTEARETLAEMAQHQSAGSKRGWPPSNQTVLSESQALGPVDSKWESLKNQHTRIDMAILDLGRLTQQYRLVTERAHQVLDRIRQDQERVQDLEFQIDETKQRWQAQAHTDPNNAVISAGLQQLMSQTDSRLAHIRHQYMRGAISYEEAVNNLRLLQDELTSARITVDDHTDIGLSEKHRRSEPYNGNGRTR